MKLDIKLPKTELECRRHIDICEEKQCPICYYAENKLISQTVDNLLESQAG